MQFLYPCVQVNRHLWQDYFQLFSGYFILNCDNLPTGARARIGFECLLPGWKIQDHCVLLGECREEALKNVFEITQIILTTTLNRLADLPRGCIAIRWTLQLLQAILNGGTQR